MKLGTVVGGWFACMAICLWAAGCARSVSAQEEFPVGLAQGVLAGEVTDTTALLQARLTSAHQMVDRHWSGILGIKGFGRFEVAENGCMYIFSKNTFVFFV